MREIRPAFVPIACALLLLGLGGCASEPQPDLGKATLADKAAADLGIARADIMESGTCTYARVPAGVQETRFFACWYAATATTLHVMDWNAKTNRFFDALRVQAGETRAVAVASSALAPGQLQLQGAGSWLVVATAIGHARAIHDRFVRAGTPEGTSPGWISGSEHVPTPVVIPIYIPAHR